MIAPEDLEITLNVLKKLAEDNELYQSPSCRDIRKTLQPLFEAQVKGMFGGETTKDKYTHRQQQKKAKSFARNQQKVEDEKFISKTILRAGRINRLETLAKEQPGLLSAAPMVLDGIADAGFTIKLLETDNASPDAETPRSELHEAIQCYTCKRRYKTLHHFYDKLCESCSELNWTKRYQTCDLTGRVCIVTGARVKIGFQTVLKLLRAGATVLATSRFARDSADRYAREVDFHIWRDRLFIYAIDFRDLVSVENFCTHVTQTFPRLDIIINNACQTIRRPAAFYAHLMDSEKRDFESLAGGLKQMLAYNEGLTGGGGGPSKPALHDGSTTARTTTEMSNENQAPRMAAADMSQLVLLPEDKVAPSNLFDTNHQQVDLRTHNSWLLKLDQVATPELAEVFAINTLAPYILVARLRGLMKATVDSMRAAVGEMTSAQDDAGASWSSCSSTETIAKRTLMHSGMGVKGARLDGKRDYQGSSGGCSSSEPRYHHSTVCFIVNVSSMEGKFYRRKLPTHPHTNMAKAALNMMTRTSAGDYMRDRIAMTSADTGWINDENPIEKAARAAERHGFATPLDEIDAAARILDPIFSPLIEGQAMGSDGSCSPPFGCFLKDFFATEW